VIGWYPLSPRARWVAGVGYDVSFLRFSDARWTFVQRSNFTAMVDHTTVINSSKNTYIVNNSKMVNDTYIDSDKRVVNKGPNVKQIEKSTGSSISSQNVDKFNSQNKSSATRNGSSNRKRRRRGQD